VIDAGVGIGEIFLEKYRVDAILGHGGMGVVALCTHLALNERVAIKMLRSDVLDDVDAVERFMREAQAAVKLKSEFVARVTDVGRSAANAPYMVMEYLEGHDLGALLTERGCIGTPWAVEITLQACEALTEAHSIGIVHRDIKPTNLFVTWRPDGSALVKVLDFGISKSPIVSAMQLTLTQSLLGTPAYMSPEQMRSARTVDARTDLWSLGTVLYEMLEGRRPFEAESFSEMCVKVAVEPPRAMTNTPRELQQVVLRCLEKTPEQRYASMAELARDLVTFSNDPHQAQVLVERMSRMLRRSQVIDWDPASNGAGRTGQRTAEIAPISPTALAEAAAAEKRTPTASTTLEVTRRKKRSALWIVALLSAAAAIGIALSLVRSPPPAEPGPPIVIAPAPAPIAPPPPPGPAPERTAVTEPTEPIKPTEPTKPIDQSTTVPTVNHAARPGRVQTAKPSGVKVGPAGTDDKSASSARCDPFADPHGDSPECQQRKAHR
jgi:serine/threonine-protein kinase